MESKLNEKGEWVDAESMECPTQLEVAWEYFLLELWRPFKRLFKNSL